MAHLDEPYMLSVLILEGHTQKGSFFIKILDFWKKGCLVGLERLIEISVNWSIDNRKTIIDEQNETIDYLLLLFC